MLQTLLPDELRALVAQRYGIALSQAERLEGGDECLIWRVMTNKCDVVVRVSPSWRSPERLTWTHRVTLALHEMLPQVVAPILALDGGTLFRYQQQSVALLPYITGTQLDWDNSAHRQEAAHLLAHIHRALLNCAPMSATLERERLLGAQPLPPAPDPAELVDPELDAWHASLSGRYKRLTMGLIHGDYYQRNLLTRVNSLLGCWTGMTCIQIILCKRWPGLPGNYATNPRVTTGILSVCRTLSGAIARRVAPARKRSTATLFLLSAGAYVRRCAATMPLWPAGSPANLSTRLASCPPSSVYEEGQPLNCGVHAGMDPPRIKASPIP